MKISVITATLNSEKFIRETVESILSQKGDFILEYIVRDGCSTDRTLDVLKEYGDDIIVVSQKDSSPQEAINNGMKMATGDIGCWLNSDDTFDPGTLQKVVDLFQKNPKVQWLYGRCKIINENNIEIRKFITWYKNFVGYYYSKNILLCENFINQPATFWKMSLWREVSSNLNANYKAAWDYELWLKMANIAPAIHLRKNLASFRRHNESISENYFEKQFNEELTISHEYGNRIHFLIHVLNIKLRTFIYRKI
ncbi:MAG TPA: glycosyltransferase family 2 protein [Victivallales bacterium]|nr:glycosyltransferase family 2 protein [Victivallales bacterium]